MFVTLSTYLLSLRLSGVLEVNTVVGWGCSTIVGGSLVGHVVGSGDGEQTYTGLLFLSVWHGGISGSSLLLFLLLVPFGAAARCSFVFCVCCQGFPCFPCVLCHFLFGSVSLDFLSLLGSGGVGGSTDGGGLSQVGFGS